MPPIQKFCECKPFIRFAQRLRVTAGRRAFLHLTAYDNRLFYCASGSGSIEIGGQTYEIKKGALMLWNAGNEYSLYTDNEMELLGCNFDYGWGHSYLAAPIPPASTNFDEKSIIERVAFSDAPCLSSVIYLNNMHLCERPLEQIYDEFTKRLAFCNEKMSAAFYSILCDIVREATFALSARGKKSKIEEILLYISEHYHEDITNTILGREFGYHPNYINHLVVQHTGMSLHKYLLNTRINRAIDMLQTTDKPVSVIAGEVGFSDYNHFLKYFKQATGYTTKAFR